MNEITELRECPITESRDALTYIDFGDMPLVNNLCNTQEEALNCPKYPLAVQFFNLSDLSALTHIVDPTQLFIDYTYRTGVNEPFKEHCRLMFESIKRRVKLGIGDFVIDIGGNDGTLLRQFKSQALDLKVVNVDPSTIARDIATKHGINCVNKFWDNFTADEIRFNMGKAKVIVSTNVFQHTHDIVNFAQAVKDTLTDDGIWVLEFPYWFDQMKTDQWDQIYHEHIYYYTLTAIQTLCKRLGLDILSAERVNIHGSSLRLMIAHGSCGYDIDNYEPLLDDESLTGALDCIQFGNRTKDHINRAHTIIESMLYQGNKIACFGAAAKGMVFLNALKLSHDDIMYCVDDTPEKQGKFIPGTGIPIVARDVLKTNRPDYVIVLAHNYGQYIADSIRNIYNGKCLVFFPWPQVLL